MCVLCYIIFRMVIITTNNSEGGLFVVEMYLSVVKLGCGWQQQEFLSWCFCTIEFASGVSVYVCTGVP